MLIVNDDLDVLALATILKRNFRRIFTEEQITFITSKARSSKQSIDAFKNTPIYENFYAHRSYGARRDLKNCKWMYKTLTEKERHFMSKVIVFCKKVIDADSDIDELGIGTLFGMALLLTPNPADQSATINLLRMLLIFHRDAGFSASA